MVSHLFAHNAPHLPSTSFDAWSHSALACTAVSSSAISTGHVFVIPSAAFARPYTSARYSKSESVSLAINGTSGRLTARFAVVLLPMRRFLETRFIPTSPWLCRTADSRAFVHTLRRLPLFDLPSTFLHTALRMSVATSVAVLIGHVLVALQEPSVAAALSASILRMCCRALTTPRRLPLAR